MHGESHEKSFQIGGPLWREYTGLGWGFTEAPFANVSLKSNLGMLESYTQSWLDLGHGPLIFLIFIMFDSRL